MLIALIPVFLVITLTFSYLFFKLNKAKKLLKNYSKAHSLPPKEVIKEFTYHYNTVAKVIKGR